MPLAFDHRLINGADAARFVAQLKNLLQEPEVLMLDQQE
ncbi:MAG: 2-oxo acid dehydrogenase subunit E2 [Sedimenticola sp.]